MTADAGAEELEDLLAEALARFDAGGDPALADFVASHPHRATELERGIRRCREMGMLGSAPLPATDVEAWLDQQIAGYLARYQVRSAQALGRLGGPEAQRALLAAQASGSLRADVASEVRKALAELEAP